MAKQHLIGEDTKNLSINKTQIIEYLQPVRCACGKLITLDAIEEYQKARKTLSHLDASLKIGFYRDCCLATLITPGQVLANFKTPELDIDLSVLQTSDPSKHKYPKLMIRPVKSSELVSKAPITLSFPKDKFSSGLIVPVKDVVVEKIDMKIYEYPRIGKKIIEETYHHSIPAPKRTS